MLVSLPTNYILSKRTLPGKANTNPLQIKTGLSDKNLSVLASSTDCRTIIILTAAKLGLAIAAALKRPFRK